MSRNLCVLLLTYSRTDYAIRTITKCLENIRWTGDLRVHIADDGSPASHVKSIQKTLDKFGVEASFSNSERGGYGKSYNLALQQVHQWANYVIPLEDDWELLRTLDCDMLAEVIANDNSGVGCIRLGYIGYTQKLQGWFEQHQGYHWLRFDPYSPEPHVFAGHPRFESTQWERSVGPWPEGLPPGETEFSVAHRLQARSGVLWPCELVRPSGDLFAHIGTLRSTDV